MILKFYKHFKFNLASFHESSTERKLSRGLKDVMRMQNLTLPFFYLPHPPSGDDSMNKLQRFSIEAERVASRLQFSALIFLFNPISMFIGNVYVNSNRKRSRRSLSKSRIEWQFVFAIMEGYCLASLSFRHAIFRFLC